MSTDLLHLIGNTPLVELPRLSPKPAVRLFAKLEGQNPTGSVKDRIVRRMVEKAEDRGDLKAGSTIVEASSGNTAIALAMIGKQRGYQVRVVIPHDVAPSIADILALYDIDVTWCPSDGGMKAAIDLARDMAETNGFYYLDQFDDQENIATHYETTGKEIVEVLPKVDVFVAGIGTGGTIMGVGRRLREVNPAVRLIGITPQIGERLQGLRDLSEGYLPPLLDLDTLDGRFLVDSVTAMEASERVAQTEGILAGISSGATLSVALRLAADLDQGTIVMMFSDGGWKYLPARPWDAAKAASGGLDDTHWW